METMRKINVGIIGCGRIFPAYAEHLTKTFAPILTVTACADIFADAAKARAAEFNIPRTMTPEEMYADADVELIVNLTVPAAHYAVTKSALQAKKSVFAEKPLAVTRAEGQELVALAKAQGARLGGAADTFLGAGLQACRRAIDQGLLGTPLNAHAFIAMGVDAPAYHKIGVGPMFDMGPYYLTALTALLGPVTRATGSAKIPFPEKPVPGAENGETFTVETPTVVSGVLDFESGCIATVTATTEIFWYWPHLQIYGTEGILIANDPNMYTGVCTVQRKSGEKIELPLPGFTEKGRGLGVAEMARALLTETPHRASGDLMYHVLDIMHAFHDASAENRHVTLESRVERPALFDYEALLR